MPAVVFEPLGSQVIAAVGESVFDAARRAGIPIPTACGGRASCGLCRVRIVEGEAHLSPINAEEVKHLGNSYFVNRLRLSCQARLLGGEVTVRLPHARRRG